jgi:protein-tyrosine-phosphatase
LDLDAYDYVIAMEKEVAKVLKTLTRREVIVWRIKDPWYDSQYGECALSILRALARLPLRKADTDA